MTVEACLPGPIAYSSQSRLYETVAIGPFTRKARVGLIPGPAFGLPLAGRLLLRALGNLSFRFRQLKLQSLKLLIIADLRI